jgi:hypothetical protein
MAKLVRIVSIIGNVERYVSETIANNPIRLKQLGFIKADIEPIEIEPERAFPVVDLASLSDEPVIKETEIPEIMEYKPKPKPTKKPKSTKK